MKISSSLIQSVAIGLTLTVAAITTSCEKEKRHSEKQTDNSERNDSGEETEDVPCPMCGMG